METYGKEFYGDYCEVINTIPQFCDLAKNSVDNIMRGAMSRIANIAAQNAQQNLSSRVSGANNTLPEGGTLFKGIRCYCNKGVPTATVHIYGDMKHNDGTWRLRFFEAGTKKRYHKEIITKPNGRKAKKKTRYIGKIEPTWFFRDAVQAAEQQAGSLIETTVSKRLKEIYDKV